MKSAAALVLIASVADIMEGDPRTQAAPLIYAENHFDAFRRRAHPDLLTWVLGAPKKRAAAVVLAYFEPWTAP